MFLASNSAWMIHPSPPPRKPPSTIALQMGLFDSLSNFLDDRGGDFIKLEDSETFGPGPALLLFNIPSNILDDELIDMLSDGAPRASRKGISMARLRSGDDILSKSLKDALQAIVEQPKSISTDVLSTDGGLLSNCPVLLFSGFFNGEMMESYKIIAGEIYQETAGNSNAACAKVVPNSMEKQLRQVLEEISGDHQDAMKEI